MHVTPYSNYITYSLATGQNAVHDKASEPTLNNLGSSVDTEDPKIILREDQYPWPASQKVCHGCSTALYDESP